MRDALWRGTLRGIVAFVLVVSAYIALKPLITYPPDPDAAWKAHYPSEVAYTYRDTCWTGPRPSWAPEVPGHVIMRLEGGHWYYGGKHWVKVALEDVFGKDDPDVYVQAFCS